MSMPWRTDLESSAPDDSTPEGLRSNDTVVCNLAVVDARRNLKYIYSVLYCACVDTMINVHVWAYVWGYK